MSAKSNKVFSCRFYFLSGTSKEMSGTMPSRRIVVRVPSGRMRVYSVYETLPGTVSTERDIPDRSSCFTCHPERSEGSLPQRCFTLFSMTIISSSPLYVHDFPVSGPSPFVFRSWLSRSKARNCPFLCFRLYFSRSKA